MLCILIFVALAQHAASAITDLNCTSYQENAMKYSEKAVNCGNKLPDKYCMDAFGQAVTAGSDMDRDGKCFKVDNNINEEVKQLVIKVCPKHCGYCCLTDAFNCNNKPFPRISCDAVTQAMCSEPTWKPIITEDCPNICGFCEASKCRDIAPYCAQHILICRNSDMQAFARENCKKTCGFCTDDKGTSTTTNCGSHSHSSTKVRSVHDNNIEKEKITKLSFSLELFDLDEEQFLQQCILHSRAEKEVLW